MIWRRGGSYDAHPPQIRLLITLSREVALWWLAVLTILFTMFGASPWR